MIRTPRPRLVRPFQSPCPAKRGAASGTSLRTTGRAVRSAVDVLIATACVDPEYALRHGGRRFEAFEKLRGLRVRRP